MLYGVLSPPSSSLAVCAYTWKGRAVAVGSSLCFPLQWRSTALASRTSPLPHNGTFNIFSVLSLLIQLWLQHGLSVSFPLGSAFRTLPQEAFSKAAFQVVP